MDFDYLFITLLIQKSFTAAALTKVKALHTEVLNIRSSCISSQMLHLAHYTSARLPATVGPGQIKKGLNNLLAPLFVYFKRKSLGYWSWMQPQCQIEGPAPLLVVRIKQGSGRYRSRGKGAEAERHHLVSPHSLLPADESAPSLLPTLCIKINPHIFVRKSSPHAKTCNSSYLRLTLTQDTGNI